ncbi:MULTISPECIES: preprotein translocase subunit SecG [Rhodobacterales]|uniref:Protein-export membrane protein SecG n=1 Tax=Halocynthiibacter styelae TaxID=2761955 RepID=A0A8J7LJK2_9RHOB|nr:MULTISPECIES: preprotein translocase subunit SecG [Rhodobacterales]MBI1492455.1 preprotein translocase subunit SecG [Paenihalocynthiibacter styelae]
MENVLLVILLIVAICLIVVVLLQRSEGGGLGMGGGGAAGGGVMSSRAAATALGKLTWIFGVAFFAASIALTIFSAKNSNGGSVIDQIGGTAPAAVEIPDNPLGEGSLLPPTTGDAELVPGYVAPAEEAPAASE